jgi:hypothetical protein
MELWLWCFINRFYLLYLRLSQIANTTAAAADASAAAAAGVTTATTVDPGPVQLSDATATNSDVVVEETADAEEFDGGGVDNACDAARTTAGEEAQVTLHEQACGGLSSVAPSTGRKRPATVRLMLLLCVFWLFFNSMIDL